MELKHCTLCEKDKPLTDYHHINGILRKHTCKQCIQKQYRVKLKLDMIKALGSICECCKESNPYFLAMDHRNNDSNIHREKLAAHQCIAEARAEGFPKNKYQLLCMNCNFAKGHWGFCPHSKGITTEMAFADMEKYLVRYGKIRQNYNTDKNLAGLQAAREELALKRQTSTKAGIVSLVKGMTKEQITELLSSLGS